MYVCACDLQIIVRVTFCATTNRVKNNSCCNSKLASHLIPPNIPPASHIYDDRRRVARSAAIARELLASHSIDFISVTSVRLPQFTNQRQDPWYRVFCARYIVLARLQQEDIGAAETGASLSNLRWSIFVCNAMLNEERNSNFNDSDDASLAAVSSRYVISKKVR